MSLFSYNGVFLPYPMSTSFQQKAVRDDSDTDWCSTEFDITIQSIIHAEHLPMVAPDLVVNGVKSTTNPADIMKAIRTRLLTHRKTLSYKFNGIELMPTRQINPNTGNPYPGTVDASNGPKPNYCNVSELTNTSFLLTYSISAAYWESLSTSPNNEFDKSTNLAGNPVLYNRWSETADYDSCQFTTRTRSGKFAIRSDNKEGATADRFRSNFAIVGVPPQFIRESSSYTVDPSGLMMSYRVVDKEQFKMPPDPAFEADMTYTESTSDPAGAKRYADVQISLKGRKDTLQSKLVDVGVTMACAKLAIVGAPLAANVAAFRGILQSSSVTVQGFRNEVSVHMRAMFPVISINAVGTVWANGMMQEAKQALAPGQRVTGVPFVDGVLRDNLTYTDRGTASILLQAAKYWDPNLAANNMGDGEFISETNPDSPKGKELNQIKTGKQVGEAGVNLE